jgi:hypothetical protein
VVSLVIPLLLLAMAGAAAAQEFRATVNGQVVDTTKAPIPGASVVIRNTETNEAATAITNDEGRFTIPFLRPGTYTLSVEMQGFTKHSRRLRLEVGQTLTLPVELAVGSMTEEVQVTSEVSMLDTSKADRGTVIDNRRIVEIPLNARNPFMLSMLVAGVNHNGNPIYQRPFDNGAIADWSINGGQNRNNEFLLDGAPNNSIQGGNNIAFVPPVDSVQEFKIMTNSYDAQYGRTSGGVVNVSLKSGTNTLHGSVYEFMRRQALDANSVVNNARGLERPEHYLDQYGIQLDGPVRIPGLYDGRDKTFFMFNYERYREGTPNPLFGTVPTEAMRNGDFSGLVDASGRLITIYDPATGRNVNGVWTRDPFPGNIIPQNRIDPVARQLLALYPQPNATATAPGLAPWQNNLEFVDHVNRDKFYNFVAKIDHNFSSRDRVYVRYGQNARNEIRNDTPIQTGPAQSGVLPLERTNYTGVADWVHIFGSSAVLNVRASASRYIELSRADAGFEYDITALGFPQSLSDQLPVNIFPRFNVTDFTWLGRGNFVREYTDTYTLQPNVSMQKGAHSIRFGADLRYTKYTRQQSGDGGMRLNFERTPTQRDFSRGDALSGNGFASLLLGAPGAGNIDYNVFPNYDWAYAAPWIQDDWKVTPKLTLNLGLRWDFNASVRESDDRMNYVFDSTAPNPVQGKIDPIRFPDLNLKGGLTFANVDGNPREPWEFDGNNLQGRLGATYQLNDKTVLRGGYGRYYMNVVTTGFTQGFSASTPFVGSVDGNRTPLYNLGNPFPTGVNQPAGSAKGLETFLGQGLNYSNTSFRIPSVDQFSIGFERQLPWNIVLEASYVGSRSRYQQTRVAINEPSRELTSQCDVTVGGSRAFCDALLPNPFYQVPGFEGTSRFTSPTLSRYELSRPFPQFGGITENERNDGEIVFDSVQFVLNKRMSNGLTLNGTYTWVPRWEQQGVGGTNFQNELNRARYVDEIGKIEASGPYIIHRPHRITASAVWDLPFGRGRKFGSEASGFWNGLISGWTVAPAFTYQTGRPWDLPANLEIVKDPYVEVNRKADNFIYGVQPCVAQRQPNGSYQLIPNSVAYGCTEPNFLVREPYQVRTTQFQNDRLRRPNFYQFDLNFAKTTKITDRIRFQIRIEAFNVFNSPMYEWSNYVNDYQNADFGRINKSTTAQGNFPRFVQLGFKLLF